MTEHSFFFLKLSQLQKVVEYLSSHLEEHIYQVETIQKRFEDEEDRIIKDTEKQIDSIYSTVRVKNSKKTKKISDEFESDTNKLKNEMNDYIKQLSEKTENSLKGVYEDLEGISTKVRNITKEMKKEVAMLREDSPKMNETEIQRQLRMMIDKHNLALQMHDAESQRKQHIIEETSNTELKKMEDEYIKVVKDLRAQIRPPPAIEKKVMAALKIMKVDITELRKELYKIRTIAKKELSKNYTTFKIQSRQMALDMEKENKDFGRQSEKLKCSLQDSIYQMKADMQISVENRNELLSKHSSEIEKLHEELRDTDPIHLYKKKLRMEEIEFENSIERIQKKIQEIKDIKSLHEKEINELKTNFNEEKNKEIALFNDQKKIIEDQIRIQQEIQEKTKEKLALQRKKQALANFSVKVIQPVTSNRSVSEVETLFNNEYAKAKIDKRTEITTTFSELDHEFNRQKDLRNSEYDRQIAAVVEEYKDTITPQITNDYEEIYNNFSNQLKEIEIPGKDSIESINDLKKRQLQLENEINESKNELINKYKDQINQEEQRFQNVSMYNDNKDYQALIIEEGNKMKQKLNLLTERIRSLEVQIEIGNQALNVNDEIKSLQENANNEIRKALQQTTDESKTLISQISSLQEEYSKKIFQEMSKNSSTPSQNEALIDKYKHNLEVKIGEKEKKISDEKKRHNEKISFVKKIHGANAQSLKRRISSLKSSINADEKSFNIEKERNQINFNKLLAEKESEMINQLPSLAISREDGSNESEIYSSTLLELNNKITLLQRERDAKKRMFNNNLGMREQERAKIDRLEIQLCDKSKLLAALGKKLVIARERSLMKEEPIPVKNLSLSGKVSSRRPASSTDIKRPPNFSHTTGKILQFK